MNLTVKEAFNWAHQGVRIEHFPVGAVIQTDDQDLIDVSEREGWTERDGTKSTTPDLAKAPAPEPEPEHPDPNPEPAVAPAPAPEPTPEPAAGRKKK